MSLDETLESRIAENIAQIRDRITVAALKSGRLATDVTLVAVTKYVGVRATRAVIAAGCVQLGEARPQDLWSKCAALAEIADQATPPIHWHMIGHLQRNKVRRSLPHLALIHSVDTERLLREIDEQSADLGRKSRVLLEINISGDQAKHGFAPAGIAPFLERLADFTNIEVCGFMAMSGLASDDTQTEREFHALRTLRDKCQTQCPSHVKLSELSMGMSGDFELAIAAGASLVRVGSSLFEGIME